MTEAKSPAPDASNPASPNPGGTGARARARRILAVVAGVAAVPALFAVANAAVDSSPTPDPSPRPAGSVMATAGTETELEHSVVTTLPHRGAAAEAEAGDDRGVGAAPAGTEPGEHPVPEPAEVEVEHGVVTTEPHGGDGHDGAPTTGPTAPVTRTFTSDGGSITVTLASEALSLDAASPAPGFAAEVHDAGPDRVEVRFSNAGVEWRIRVEPARGSMSVEITAHD